MYCVLVGHQNGPETSRTVQHTTQPHMLSCQAVSTVTPVTQSRPIHSRSTSGIMYMLCLYYEYIL